MANSLRTYKLNPEDFQEDVEEVFKTLRNEYGFFAKGPHMCCQNCGFAAINEDKFQGIVFYHEQDEEFLEDNNFQLFLSYDGCKGLSQLGAGRIVQNEFERAGFKVTWDEDITHRIIVEPRNK